MPRLRSSLVTASISLFVLSAAAVPSAAGGGEAGKSPEAILSDVKRDLAKVKSLHFTGRQSEKGATTRTSGDIFASGAANMTVVEGRTSAQMILLPKATYLKANAGYWRVAGGKYGNQLAAKLAGRWVKVPASVGAGLRPLLKKLTPKYLASCVSTGLGTLANKGVQTLGGREVIVLEDKGDKPGTTPGLLYVAAEGRVLPLREIQTGRRKAGGKVDGRCDTPEDKSTAAEFTFGRFDRVPQLKAPRNALSLENPGTTA
jgi:hypothetical protein